jgi:hypothetical protein
MKQNRWAPVLPIAPIARTRMYIVDLASSYGQPKVVEGTVLNRLSDCALATRTHTRPGKGVVMIAAFRIMLWVLIGAFLSACGQDDPDDPILGLWQTTQSGQTDRQYQFFADGSAIVSSKTTEGNLVEWDDSATWERLADGGIRIVRYLGWLPEDLRHNRINEYQLEIEGDRLTFLWPDSLIERSAGIGMASGSGRAWEGQRIAAEAGEGRVAVSAKKDREESRKQKVKRGSPSDIVQRAYAEANAGNYTTAMEYCSSEVHEFIKEMGAFAGGVKGLWDKATRNGTIDWVEILSEEIRGEGAAVHFRLHFKDGTVEDSNEDLLKEKGKWKISLG